jgi:predicted NAD/FAD-dependent oxidoreductase
MSGAPFPYAEAAEVDLQRYVRKFSPEVGIKKARAPRRCVRQRDATQGGMIRNTLVPIAQIRRLPRGIRFDHLVCAHNRATTLPWADRAWRDVATCVARRHREFAEVFMTAPSPGMLAATIQDPHCDSRAAYLLCARSRGDTEYEVIVRAGFVLRIDAPGLALE